VNKHAFPVADEGDETFYDNDLEPRSFNKSLKPMLERNLICHKFILALKRCSALL
jgi:hypothetical protein